MLKSLMKLDEELQSLQLDRPIGGKSAHQLQKHTIDEQYDNKPIERSLYILTKGDDIQKLSVIQSLPELLQTDNNATVTRIIPKIQQELPNSSSEFHLVTSKIFKLLIEMKLNLNLMRPVLQGIESKDPIVSNAWIETLLAVIHSLAEATIKNEVLPFAVKISQLNRPVNYRIASCRIFGEIAVHTKISSFEVKKDVLPIVQSLCQDCLHEVRAAMCTELPHIAKGLGNDSVVKSSLLPCLVELSSDENMAVRAAAVDTVVLLVPHLNSETIKNTIIPLVKRLCIQSGKEGDQTYTSIARIFGLLISNLQVHLSHNDSIWFLDYFKDLSRRGLNITDEELDVDTGLAVSCREFCAFNLPAVTFFTISQAATELHKWYLIFKDLAGDPYYIVRKIVAGCIHEITRILGKDCKSIVVDIVKLLRDDAEEVLDALVPNIGCTLELLTSAGILSRDTTTQSTLEIGRALLKCQVELFKYYNWRRKMAFLAQLEHLPNCMASDFIHQHFTPVVLRLTLEARSRPVRTQAARTMLIFLRYSSKENHRKWIRENLINLLCNSQSCYTRHIFINMCVHAMQVFSWKYFKEHFYLPLLTLGDDPVSTVRLCVVNLCPFLKQMLTLPVDRNLQLRLENFVSKIEVMENDKDVLATLKNKLKEMRTPQVNKQEALMEERRKIEEEDKIQQGKIASSPLIGMRQTPSPRPVRDSSRRNNAITVSRSSSFQRKSPTSTSSASEMSFLGQHFYIDAGVALPEEAAVNNETKDETVVYLEESMAQIKLELPEFKKSDDEIIPTVSVENTNIENMSDEDLKELEISTSNITDDVKANIQKISLSKSTTKSKLPIESVKKRNKRHSCVISADHVPGSSKNALKRRSLNIGAGEISKIPICFRTSKKNEQNSNMRSKSGSVQSICYKNFDTRLEPLRFKLSVINDDKRQQDHCSIKQCITIDNTVVNSKVEENVHISDSIKKNVPINRKEYNITKGSNLPVLIRHLQK